MSNLKIEIKWAIIFSVIGLMWMVLEKLVGLHSTHIDKHMYLTNLFAIPAIIVMVLALKDKKRVFYKGLMSYGYYTSKHATHFSLSVPVVSVQNVPFW